MIITNIKDCRFNANVKLKDNIVSGAIMTSIHTPFSPFYTMNMCGTELTSCLHYIVHYSKCV